MDTRYIRTFLAAARHENFRQAARELGISQPAVSQQIEALSQEFGVKLFAKAGRGVELSRDGQMLLDAAEALAEAERAMQLRVAMLRRHELGRIVIGYSISIMLEMRLPDVLRRFTEAHPAVQLVLDPMRVADAVEALRQRRIDLAIMRAPLPPLGEDLQSFLFGRARLVLAVPNGHRLARATEVEWSQLSGQTMLTMADPKGIGLRHVVDTILQAQGVVPGRLQMIADMSTLVGMVAAGMGVALLPEAIAHSHRGISTITIGNAAAFVDAVAVTRAVPESVLAQHLVTRLKRAALRV